MKIMIFSNIPKYFQIFQIFQIFSNIFKYFHRFSIIFKIFPMFLGISKDPLDFFPEGRNIQGLLGCQAVAKACSVVALVVPDDPFA